MHEGIGGFKVLNIKKYTLTFCKLFENAKRTPKKTQRNVICLLKAQASIVEMNFRL
jgi:hypothetical protein